MRKIYIIELGGEKERKEMKALELKNNWQALKWIKNSIESDKEYFNIKYLNLMIMIIKQKENNIQKNIITEALIYVKYNEQLTKQMKKSNYKSVKQIIEENLNIVSKIVEILE